VITNTSLLTGLVTSALVLTIPINAVRKEGNGQDEKGVIEADSLFFKTPPKTFLLKPA
jgi:hypothetical protein